MSKKLILAFIFLGLLVRYGHSIRNVGFDKIPENYNLLDERTNVWHGLSIRNTGVPAAWSDLRSYWEKWPKSITETKDRLDPNLQGFSLVNFNIYQGGEKPQLLPQRNFPELRIFTAEYDFGAGKRYTSIVQPYLDHPPFGALVLSTLVSKKDANTYNLKADDFRKTSLWLADLTAILIFIFAYQISQNPLIGLLSTAIYESVPTYLFTSRLALLENVLIPVNLLSVILLTLAINLKKSFNKKIYMLLLIIAGIISGLAFLTKTTGISVLISGVAFLILQKESRKNIFIFAIPGFIVGSIYFIWGFILAPHIFPKILIEQSTNRIFVGFLGLIQQLFKYGMESFPVDGWWIGGFLTMLFLKFTQKTSPLIISIIALFFIIPFTGGSLFPWYLIPLIPFASISSALFIGNLAKSPDTISVLIFFLFLFSSSYFWSHGVFGAAPNFNNHQTQFLIYKFFLIVFFGLAILVNYFHQKSKLFQVSWFLIIVVLTAVLIRWNFSSIFYMITNWGHLIRNLSPNWVL